MDFNQIINQFQAEFLANGITPPDEIIADGNLHRFHIEGDKSGSKNGWYVLHLDGLPCGIFGSWKKGGHLKWSAKDQGCMTKAERRNQMERIKEACKIRNAMKDKEQQEAASLAENLWDGYPKANPQHPYLKKKRISPYFARQYYQEIVLPVIDVDGKVWGCSISMNVVKKVFVKAGQLKNILYLFSINQIIIKE